MKALKTQLNSWPKLGSVLLLALCLVCLGARAQTPLSDLVFTVGTTIRNGANDWSFVLLGTPDQALLTGKRFAVYGKAGDAASAAAFTLRGTIFQPADAATVNNRLNQSLALGEDLSGLADALTMLLHNVPGITNLTLAEKVLAGFQLSGADPLTAQLLGLLSRAHPGLSLCLGQSFAEPITSVTTYEVREVNLATGVAGDVVGRVTITPGAPVVLPAPGKPFQVVTNLPSENLLIRLRWGTPPELRRLSLLGYGFNVWRAPRAYAEAGNFNVTPPALTNLYHDTNFTRANNNKLVTPSKSFLAGTGLPGTADDMADPTTVFFTDNNGRALGNVHFPTNIPTTAGYQVQVPPFNDGDQFYYFITARDILGRDGLVSPGGLASACRRIPPRAPTEVTVRNETQVLPAGSTTTNQQYLRVVWQQNTNATDAVTAYWVYRWPNPAMAFTNDAAPLSNRVGVVTHVFGTNTGTFLDKGSDAPLVPGLTTYWYTVRAVRAACAACNPLLPLLSPHSPPASGVLRRRDGPAAATGEVIGSCGTPAVMFQSFVRIPESGLDTNRWNYSFACDRRDPGVAWVQFFVTNQVTGGFETFGPIYFPPDGNHLEMDYSLPITPNLYTVDVVCVVGTVYGLVSPPATYRFRDPVAAGERWEAGFLAGQVLLTAASLSDPLLAALNGPTPVFLNAFSVTADPSGGTVSMLFEPGGNPPIMVQVLTNGSWADVASATPDAHGFYSVVYPSCVLCPLPMFRGCVLRNLPGEADCSQHVARAANNGPVAPIRVRFRLTPRTREYRLYRQVNDGPLALISQGAAVFDPANPTRLILNTDDAMPVSAGRLCYYVQLLDEHGNPSPMASMGCKDVTPPTMPIPVLAEPVPAGSNSQPQVTLNWFCPTSGVYRFQVLISTDKPAANTNVSSVSSASLRKFQAFNLAALYPGLVQHYKPAHHPVPAMLKFDEVQITPPVGVGFGPGPQFSLTANILANVAYTFSVAAIPAQGTNGPPSLARQFTWRPIQPPVTVPWPQRPLPPVKDFDDQGPPRVQAVLFVDYQNQIADPRYPVGIRIGELWRNVDSLGNVGTTNFVGYWTPGFGSVDPNLRVYRRLSNDPSRTGDPLLPIVVYRQQVTNAAFPRVSGDVTQVTPLLERIAWQDPNGNGTSAIVPDRLIAMDNSVPRVLYLRDSQPVTYGASYRYFVVRFNANGATSGSGEVAEVIPAGMVTIQNSN
jgi:hypothetical protein